MPPKRTNKGAGSSTGAGRSGIVDPASYADYDEAMEDGVELEEKGERFQFGPKAQRFYEQAGQLYRRAAVLAPAANHAADALYNAARIKFLLGTQFYLVPQNINAIAESVQTGTAALEKLNKPLHLEPGQLADPFLLDVVSARATASQCLADLWDEVGDWPPGQPAQLAEDGLRANQLLKSIELWRSAHEGFEFVALAQHAILVDQMTSVEGDSVEPAEVDSDADMPVDDAPNGNDVYGYTSSLVTTVSLIDSQLSSLACLTSLIQTAQSPQSAQDLDAQAQTTLALTESWFTAEARLPPITDEKEQTEKKQELLRAQLSLRTTLIGKAVELHAKGQAASDIGSIQAQVQSAMEHVHEWANRLLATDSESGAGKTAKMDVATLCDVGEAGQTLCRLALRLLVGGWPNGDTAQAIWTLATLSTKLYSSALSALDTAGSGSAAVLGQANTSTPTSRARCRILMALSTFSIFRSNPAFEQAGVPGAIGTRAKLIDNARLYARKAVTEIGLTSLLRDPDNSVSRKAPYAAPPGGWDSLTLQAEALFVLLRSLLYRYKVAGAAENELRAALAHLGYLQQTPIVNNPGLDVAIWLYKKGASTFVDQFVDENGTQTSQEEAGWWQEVLSGEQFARTQ